MKSTHDPLEHTVYLALGANLGERSKNLARALAELSTQVSIHRVSSFYETDPIGYLDQPRFLNLVCAGQTVLAPLALLTFVKEIEATLGRTPSFRNAPRPIDIDILLYESLQMHEEQLTIPHPRMLERSFVLAPLAEIAPDLVIPGSSGQSVQQLLALLPPQGIEKLSASIQDLLSKQAGDRLE